MNKNQTIVLYQPLLQSIAYKMVGSLADAEDIVQDTLTRWLTVDTEKIKNTKSYLVRSVKNNCINHIEKLKRNESISQLNMEIVDWYREKEFFKFDRENELAAAWHVLHKKLEPVEKGIFVLRELFDFDYEELQEIFNKKKDNCRKLFSRARHKLASDASLNKIPEKNTYSSFYSACKFGSLNDLIENLRPKSKNKQKKSV
ncbi:MAG: sigma-70 family RNA polymerase sigma factor [Fulvivirga sp.]|nr:sigma-70 family RNA polymerase sigma factor [Fulvivirga sp.]